MFSHPALVQSYGTGHEFLEAGNITPWRTTGPEVKNVFDKSELSHLQGTRP